MRTAVLTAALDELADYGYIGINMQRLAERAQVNKTTLYRRWGTKGALIADALIAGSEGLEPVDTGSLRGDLMALNATMPAASAGRDRLAQAAAISNALDQMPDEPDVLAAREALWSRRLEIVEAAVGRAKERGEIRADADPELILDVLFGAFHTRVVSRRQPLTAEFLAGIAEVVLR